MERKMRKKGIVEYHNDTVQVPTHTFTLYTLDTEIATLLGEQVYEYLQLATTKVLSEDLHIFSGDCIWLKQ